jgi:hypothetical protein
MARDGIAEILLPPRLLVAEKMLIVVLLFQLHCLGQDFFNGLHNQFRAFTMALWPVWVSRI